MLISVYRKDNGGHLKIALSSLIDQTVKPDEIVLVVDGAIPNELRSVIDNFKKDFEGTFKQIELEKNRGLAYALNQGLVKCSHELVARMDADDISYPDRFETQYNHMIKNQQLAVVGCNIQEFNQHPGDLNLFRSLPCGYMDIIRFSKRRNPLNHPSVMFRKSPVLQVGSYKRMPLFEDFYLWIRLLKAGYRIENLQQPLLHFRIGNNMIGRRHGWSYLRSELTFLNTSLIERHITFGEYAIIIPIKIVLRLMPLWILKRFYKHLLRSKQI